MPQLRNSSGVQLNYIKVILLGLLLSATSLSFSQDYTLTKIDPHVYKFKKVNEGEPVVMEFTIRNLSPKETLNILQIESSCTCTNAEFSDEPIAPGQERKFKVHFNTENKFGFQQRPVKITFTNGVQIDARFQGVVKGTKETIQKYKESQKK